MRHQQFFKATYWVTTIIDYINGLPLEKESNYILVQIAKCRLISNLLGSPSCSFPEIRNRAVGQESQITAKKLEMRKGFALSLNKQASSALPSACQLCSRRWSCRRKQHKVPFVVATPRPQHPKCSWTHLSNYWDSFSEHRLGLGTCNPGVVNLLAPKAEIFRGGKGLRGSWWGD